MNVSKHIKTNEEMSIEKETIIHLMLVNNSVNERISNALKPFDVSIQQFNVLRILRGQNNKPANLSTLNERMVTKMSNTTRLVDKLILKGYVDRITCPSNRRKVEINITSKGKEILKKMDITISKVESKIVEHLSIKDMEQLNSILNKF